VKAILFDFDGTLVNSAPGIVKTMEQTFLREGFPVPTEAAMRATIGLPLRQALQMLSGCDDAMADRLTDTYPELFPIYEVGYVHIFPGVPETLQLLRDKGLRLAIVTSRDVHSLDMILQHHNLTDLFETRITAADGLTPKPAPDMTIALMQRMNLTSDECIVVGDTTFDISMGNAAGCQTIAVTYGNHTREQLLSVSPTYLIDQFPDLVQYI